MYQSTNPGHENALPGIRCDVTNCHYNDQKCCVASQIKVGPQFAASSADTVCDTFKPR